MDTSTFMIGYFVGLAIGAFAVIAWTGRYGRVSLKSIANWWHDLADWTRKADDAAFSSKRDRPITKHPAE